MISLTNSQIGELMGQFLLAGTGTLSFAILFACPRRSLPTCALVGAMGWFVYELCVMLGLGWSVGSTQIAPSAARKSKLSTPLGALPMSSSCKKASMFCGLSCGRRASAWLMAWTKAGE